MFNVAPRAGLDISVEGRRLSGQQSAFVRMTRNALIAGDAREWSMAGLALVIQIRVRKRQLTGNDSALPQRAQPRPVSMHAMHRIRGHCRDYRDREEGSKFHSHLSPK